jgi:hypothetical protein
MADYSAYAGGNDAWVNREMNSPEEDEEEEVLQDKNKNPTVRLSNKRKSSGGFSYLRSQLLESNESMSDAANCLLRNLLQERKVDLDEKCDSEEDFEKEPVAKLKKHLQTVESTMSDESILHLAKSGQLSFLASLLEMVAASQEPVSTRHLIKTCCLAINPRKVPVHMDAKEMVTAALHFLSSECAAKDDDILPSLPLLRPLESLADLERRTYEKAGNWKLSEIKEKVMALEDIFLEDSTSYKWLAREKFCPRIKVGEDLLLAKGSPPAYATGKTKKPATAQRKQLKKAVDPKLHLRKLPQDDPVAVDAARVMQDDLVDPLLRYGTMCSS